MTATFKCPYADPGQSRCSPSICDCFIEQFPDDPFGLHPEAFLVDGHPCCPMACLNRLAEQCVIHRPKEKND